MPRSEHPLDSSSESSSHTASGRFATRSLRLSARLASQLIQDALAEGGEIWVKGSGQSMFPTIRNADDVLLSPLRRGVRRGDIVLVPLGPGLMLHRVVTVAPNRIITRGDARTADDLPIAPDEVRAHAVAVRRDSRVSALVPTLRFGAPPFLRYVVEIARRSARSVRSLRRRRDATA